MFGFFERERFTPAAFDNLFSMLVEDTRYTKARIENRVITVKYGLLDGRHAQVI
jgi:hypothetical protein|tara:strand:+ start:7701 stop:7862 length:162 start_codon:yes stop_codon:yes gene_type:complete